MGWCTGHWFCIDSGDDTFTYWYGGFAQTLKGQ
jgi:hypothetical protein